MRVKRLLSDADILAWYARVQRYHETQLSARELGFPERDWTTFEEEKNAKGRTVRRRVEKMVGSREVSLLAKEADARTLTLPQLAGGDPRPFEVVGIPLAEPGYHVVEIESLRLGQSLLDKRAPMFVRTGVLVTNLGVHFKHGRENSVVWVTALDRGKPVEGAEVVVNDCNGRPLWSGKSDANGLAVVPRALDDNPDHCIAYGGYFVSARSAGGRRVRLQQLAEGHRVVALPRADRARQRARPARVDGVRPDALPRRRDGVDEALRARRDVSGLAQVPADRLPTRVKIVHQGSGQEVILPLTWTGGGRSALTTWNIPPAAKLGVYDIVLERERAPGARAARDSDEGGRERSWTSGNFRVEEFRLPLVDARVSGPKTAPIAAASVNVDVQMSYFAGGAMASAALRASALLKNRSIDFPGYDEFSFEPARDPNQAEAPESDESESDDERPRREAHRRQGAARDRPQRRRDAGAEGPAEVDAAGADRCRGHVQRSERRDPDRGDADRPLAERARPRRQDRQLGEQPRAREVQRRRARHLRQADQGPERRGARPRQPGHHDQEAPGRRLLRLRQPHRSEGPRQPLLGTTDDRGLLLCEASSRPPARSS